MNKYTVILTSLIFIISISLIGCQGSSVECVQTRQEWEYMELSIICDVRNPPCRLIPDEEYKYSSRADILNEYGEQGWEVISEIERSYLSLKYLLKRPILE